MRSVGRWIKPQRNSVISRFGVFQLDRSSGELHKSGLKIRLEDKPFRLLIALLDRPDEVVTREELRTALWPDTTFGEFDHSLNNAVRKVRVALGDSPNSPRYIETVPKRGYRFIYPVENGHRSSAASPDTDHRPSPPKRTRAVWYIAATAVLLAVAALMTVGSLYFGSPRSEPAGPLPAVHLTSYKGAEVNPSFSPDGNQVAFCWNGEQQDNYDVYVKVIGSGDPLRLTSTPDDEISPAWSPDGRVIAFIRGSGIYTIAPLGGGERKIAEVDGLSKTLAWSPDGGALLIGVRALSGPPRSVYLLSIQSGAKRQLTWPARGLGDGMAAFSPDGKHIAFNRIEPGIRRINVVAVGGGKPTELTVIRGDLGGLFWMSSGREIVYSAGNPGSTKSLSKISVSSGEVSPLMGFATGGGRPAVSYTANRMVYESQTNAIGIWRYELPTAVAEQEPPQMLSASNRQEIQPSISPDGKRVAFVSARTGTREIWTSKSDGTDSVQVTTTGDATTCFPSWSPGGSRIAFNSNLDGAFDIYVIDAAGGVPTRVTTGRVDDGKASWSKDGEWIYFKSSRSGSAQIWKTSAAGGDAVQITNSGGSQPQVSPDGQFLYFTRPEGGLWRVPVEGGEESLVKTAIRQYWRVTEGGVYFARGFRYGRPERPAPPSGKWLLKFQNFDTNEVSVVRALEHGPVWGVIDLSPDGRWLVCAHKLQEIDLMLVENFQ